MTHSRTHPSHSAQPLIRGGSHIDRDGYVHMMTRTDDVMNVAGHRLSSGALEEACSTHEAVVECAVVGAADELKGAMPVAFLVLQSDGCDEGKVAAEVSALVRQRVGAVASLRAAIVVPALPKTRSGKVLRTVLRAICDGTPYKVPGTIEDRSVLIAVENSTRARFSPP